MPRVDAAQRGFQKAVFTEYLARAHPEPRLDPRSLATAGLTFARAGDLAEAERAAEILFKQAPGEPRLRVVWEALALALAQAGGDEANLKKAKRYRALMSAQAKAGATRPA